MSFIYNTLFYNPLYNTLLFILKILPLADIGLAVIVMTIIVRLILFPLSRKAVLTQMRMSELDPELEVIKTKYKDKPEEQARKTLALYQEKKVNPFSGIFVILIQIPIIFALYHIFLNLAKTDGINTLFLGIFDISGKSIILSVLAALSTYIQFKVSSRSQTIPQGNSLGDNLARSMQVQMKYFFPVIMFFVSYSTSAVIALYFVTTNVFSVLQELLIRGRQPKV